MAISLISPALGCIETSVSTFSLNSDTDSALSMRTPSRTSPTSSLILTHFALTAAASSRAEASIAAKVEVGNPGLMGDELAQAVAEFTRGWG